MQGTQRVSRNAEALIVRAALSVPDDGTVSLSGIGISAEVLPHILDGCLVQLQHTSWAMPR